jgi:hypothetical protein
MGKHTTEQRGRVEVSVRDCEVISWRMYMVNFSLQLS